MFGKMKFVLSSLLFRPLPYEYAHFYLFARLPMNHMLNSYVDWTEGHIYRKFLIYFFLVFSALQNLFAIPLGKFCVKIKSSYMSNFTQWEGRCTSSQSG